MCVREREREREGERARQRVTHILNFIIIVLVVIMAVKVTSALRRTPSKRRFNEEKYILKNDQNTQQLYRNRKCPQVSIVICWPLHDLSIVTYRFCTTQRYNIMYKIMIVE